MGDPHHEKEVYGLGSSTQVELPGSWVVTITTAGAIMISDPWVLYFPFAPCLSCMRSCTNRSSPRIIVGAVSSHRHIPVQHKGCKNHLTFSAVLIQWPLSACPSTCRSLEAGMSQRTLRSTGYNMVVIILGWAWWALYFITCWCFAEGPLSGRSTQR